ncbi:MAG: NAD(P)H-dependent oxidoreductase [Verrucomicrobiales bacterium]|nr:NAD(P)H-dependent oxidoreductase [Verrucomicrobiales bacterium]
MSYLLHLDASGRQNGSTSRAASDAHAKTLAAELGLEIRTRDLSQGLPFVNETMIEGYFTPEDQRTEAHREALQTSDELVEELMKAKALIIGIPVYNFSMPASFKAWADLVARFGVTVIYNEEGRPVGQAPNMPTKVFVAYGGTEIGSKRDFLTPWMTTFLNYIGIQDIEYQPAAED